MDNLIKLIKEKPSIVIANEYVKEKIILSLDGLIDVTFKTPINATNDLFGYYDDIAIYEIKHILNLKYDRAKKIYDALIISKKLDDLKDLRDKLNKYYHEPKIYDKKRIIVVSKLPKLLENELKRLSKLDYEIIFYDRKPVNNNNNNNIVAYEYKSIINEVEDLANNICELIDNNKLDIAVYYNDPEYLEVIKDVFPFYNLSYRLDNEIDLLSIPAINEAIKKGIDGNINLDEINNPIAKDALITMFNYFSKIDKFSIEDAFDWLKNTSINTKKIGIKVLPYDYFNNLFEYSFIVGTAFSIIPSISKDMLYYNDKVYQDLDLRDSFMENMYEKEYFYKTASSCDNLTISFSYNGISKSFQKTDLLDNLNIKFIPREVDYTYSKKRCYLEYAKEVELKKLFNEENKNLKSYEKEFEKVDMYDASFSISDINLIKDVLVKNGTINMSYSKLQTYLECPFRFYGENILKVKPYKPSAASIGNIMHKFAEEYVKNNNYTLQDAIDAYNEIEKTNHPEEYEEFKLEKIYYDKFNEIVKLLINELDNEKERLNLDDSNIDTEKEVKNYKIDGTYPILLEGKIDKVIDLNGKKIIVDYKTTDAISLKAKDNEELSKDDIKRNQMFVYAILLNLNYEDFIGIYYQYIFPKKKNDINNSFFYPKGYDNENYNIDFSVAKNIGLNKEAYDKQKKQVIDYLIKFREMALEGHFDIKPIDDACTYCDFKGLCHKKIRKDDVDE